MKITRAQVYRYILPLRTPLVLSTGTVHKRTGFLLKLTGRNGTVGWGEAAPLPGFSRESLQEAWNAILRCARLLQGKVFPETRTAFEGLGLMPLLRVRSVSFALESAALQLRAAQSKTPSVHRYLASDSPDEIPLNALLTGSREEVLLRACEATEKGYRAVKLKVGRTSIEEEIALVHAVRAAVGERIALRLDANRAWDLDTAVAFGKQVAVCGVEYIEEPLEDPAHLRFFTESTGIPYALDETLMTLERVAEPFSTQEEVSAEELRMLDLLNHAAACIWKPMLMHFPNIGAVLAQHPLLPKRIIVSSTFESGVGLAMLANYAAVCCPNTPVGLDTYGWLAEDILEQPLALDTGTAQVATLSQRSRRVAEDRLESVWEG